VGLLLVGWLIVAQFRHWRRCWRSADPTLHRIGLAGLLFVIVLITKNLTDDFLQDPVSMLCWGWIGWLAGQQAQRQDALQNKAP
jgi:O-antigen ligase